MARLYPEHFPYSANPDDPEFEMFQVFRKLPQHYSVFYSRKFKGGPRSREECEIDFIVFDGARSLLCVEVKGGEIGYNGEEEAWYQNGKKMTKAPDRQASSGMRAVMDFLGTDCSDVNIGWALCFPNCSLPAHCRMPSALPRDILLDEKSLLEPEVSLARVQD